MTTMPTDTTVTRWSVVIPVKRLPLAKSRLELPPAVRAEVALAMAVDTAAAAVHCAAVSEVLVVTDDEQVSAAVSDIGARVVGDLPNAGLNAALVHGASEATNVAVAMVSSDLPGLAATDFHALLRAASAHAASVVADLAGTGTTVLAIRSPSTVVPRFGTNSFAAHLDDGTIDLSAVAAPGLRRDVDTLADLREAMVLGVGAATARAVAGITV